MNDLIENCKKIRKECLLPHQDPAGARLARDELAGPVLGHGHEVAVVLAGVGVLPLQPQLLRLLLLPP